MVVELFQGPFFLLFFFLMAVASSGHDHHANFSVIEIQLQIWSLAISKDQPFK
jgi:hypothetical protein